MLQPLASCRSITVIVEIAPALFASSLASASRAVLPSCSMSTVPSSCRAVIRADGEVLVGGDLIGALERRSRRLHVARPLGPPDHLQRVEGDVGGPARQSGRLGLRQRSVRELAGLVDVACFDRAVRGGRVDLARQGRVGDPFGDGARGGEVLGGLCRAVL